MRVLCLIFVMTTLARAQDLGGARRLLAGSREQEVQRGTAACVQANSAKAVGLLLETLAETRRRGLAPAHYRDIAWGGLIRITAKEAHARVRKELATNPSGWVRQWCAELLGIYGDPEFAPALVKALRDKHKGVKRWAARSLGMLRYKPAEKALLGLTSYKNPFVRANAIEALAWIDPAGHRVVFLRALKGDADGGVRCALVGAVPGIYTEDARQLSADALEDKDWRPRLQAVDNLAQIRTKLSVDALVKAAADGRPIVGYRAITGLQRMTGKEIHDADSWKGWWAQNRETFQFPEGDSEGGGGRQGEKRTIAFGIPIVSDHVAFIMDKSQRMRDLLQTANASKDVAAHRELGRVLAELHGRLVFNVYVYREDVKAFRKRPVPLDAKMQKKALKFVGAERDRGAKDIWKVLEAVVSDPDIDTAYLLSSGEPDVGLYVHWNRVTRHLRDLNRFQKVTVHTVVYSERKWYRDQLEKIAEATGGKFKWFQ